MKARMGITRRVCAGTTRPAVIALGLFLTPTAFANLVQNGSFETLTYVPLRFEPWTYEGSNGAICSGCNPPDGRNYLILGGSVFQTIDTVPGQQYLLSFAYAQNFRTPAPVELDVLWGGTLALHKVLDNPPAFTWESLQWRWQEIPLVATAEFTELRFWDGGDWQATLDAIQLQPIPEPGSALILAAGLLCFWTFRQFGVRQKNPRALQSVPSR